LALLYRSEGRLYMRQLERAPREANKRKNDNIGTRGDMTLKRSTLLAHLILLLLAATNFTFVTAALGHPGLTWDFASYAYRNGWGYTYRSDYSFAQVLTYIAAYAAGAVVYPSLTRPKWLAVGATLICIAGLASFVIELSHWFLDHHLCLIASFPILLIPLGIWGLAAPRLMSLPYKHSTAN
jgi:hypothetical protein